MNDETLRHNVMAHTRRAYAERALKEVHFENDSRRLFSRVLILHACLCQALGLALRPNFRNGLLSNQPLNLLPAAVVSISLHDQDSEIRG